jgi:hypothetical protein
MSRLKNSMPPWVFLIPTPLMILFRNNTSQLFIDEGRQHGSNPKDSNRLIPG